MQSKSVLHPARFWRNKRKTISNKLIDLAMKMVGRSAAREVSCGIGKHQEGFVAHPIAGLPPEREIIFGISVTKKSVGDSLFEVHGLI